MENSKNEEILIIGAGPAGMAAAMELTHADKDFCLVEKNSGVGGLSRTYSVKEGNLEFRTDNGPHRFFSKNKYLYDFIEDILHDNWSQVDRYTQQFIAGKFFDYPINAIQVVKNLGAIAVLMAGWDYMLAFVKYKVFRRPINNFYDYAVANFGYSLAKLNILGYTEKVWGISCKNLHADWAKQRISGLDLISLLKNLILRALPKKIRNQNVKTLVDRFYYPEFGTGTIYEKIADKIIAAGHKVYLNSHPISINHSGGLITSVDLALDGQNTRMYPRYLIESVHIDDFLKLLNPKPPENVKRAASALKYRSQVYLFLTLNKEKVSRNQWIYFPEPEVPFARISEMRNFSQRMSPPGMTSLFIEFFCNEGDDIYKMNATELLDLSLPYLQSMGFLLRSDIRNFYAFKGGKDYPIYDLGYDVNLNIVKKYLDSFKNLYYIGRPGRFKYTNQDHSLEMGILAAKSIIENKKYNFDEVGAEKEYFEKGYTPPKS